MCLLYVDYIKKGVSFKKKFLSRPSKSLVVVSVFLFALLLRIIFAIEWHAMPYGSAPLLDAQSYDDWALSIAQGRGGFSHAFYQSPLYPYLLASLYVVCGHSYFAASLLNALLDGTTASLLALISFSFYGRLAAIVTGLLATTYLPMIFYTAPLMKEPLMLLLLTIFLLMALKAIKDNHLRHYILSGVFFGLAVLARGNLLLLIPLLPFFAWRRYKKRALKGTLCFVGMVILNVLPVTLYNAVQSHSFIPLTYADGFNLYIGHSPYANGTNAYPPEVSTDPEQERLNTTWIAEDKTHKQLSPSEVSAYWRAKAIDYAIQNPLREVELLGLKSFAFWNNAESFDNYDISFIKQNFASLLNLPLTNFWLIVTLATFAIFGGAARLEPKKKDLTPLLITSLIVYMLAVVIFYVTDRYRLPVVIFLLPLAGAAIPTAALLWKTKLRKRFLLAVLMSLLALGITLHKPLNASELSAFDWGVLTTIYANKNDPASAFDAFRKGVALSPENVGAQAYIRSAELEERLGHPSESEALVKKAAEIYPEDGVAIYNLGRIEAFHGNWDQAILILNRSLSLAPTYGLTYYALAVIYKKKGDTEHAQNILLEGLAANPSDERLLTLAKEWDLR